MSIQEKPIVGNVIFCSDPRPGAANLWKHIKHDLIPQDEIWNPIGQLGAPVTLARPEDFPVKFACVMEDLEFAMKKFAQGRFMVVGHDCGIYDRLAPRRFSFMAKQRDMIRAAKLLKKRFPGMPVRAFFFFGQAGFQQLYPICPRP